MTVTLSPRTATDVSSHPSIVQPRTAAALDEAPPGFSAEKQPIVEGDRRAEQAAKLIGGTLLPGGYFLADRFIARRLAARLHCRLERAFSAETEEPTKHSKTTREYIHWLIDRDIGSQVSHDMRDNLLDHSIFETGGLLIALLSSSGETLTSGLRNAVICYGATKIFEFAQNRRQHREHDIAGQINAIFRLRAGNAVWSRMVRGR